MKFLSEIKFGDLDLRAARTSQKYDLHGVAFIKDQTPIGFVFECPYSGHLRLEIEALDNSKELYSAFKKIFTIDSASMSKNWLTGNSLNVNLNLETTNREVVLQNIEKQMGIKWRRAFETLFSVHER